MKKVLINFDSQKFGYEMDGLTSLQNRLEKIIELYNSLNADPFQHKDLKPLILDTSNFLFKSLMKGKPTEFAGVLLKKEEVFRLMEKPVNYSVIISEAKKWAADIEYRSKEMKKSVLRGCATEKVLRFFIIDDEGQLFVKQEIIDQAKGLFEEYAVTPKAIFIFSTAQTICSLMNESDVFKGFFSDDGILKNELQNIINCIEIRKGKFELNIDRIKYSV